MSYPYQIKSLEQYQTAYKQSVEDPEAFWGDIAENFYGGKNGIKCWNGILRNQKLNGSKAAN